MIEVSITAPDSGNPYDVYETGQVATTPNSNPDGTPDGTFGLSSVGYGPSFNCNWSITVNPDPQITSTFTLKNLSAVTQTFIMNVTLPIGSLGPTTVQNGYLGDPVIGTQYTDTSGDGDVTLWTVPGIPFYQALVNGAVSQGLGSFDPSAGPVPPFPGGLNANGGAGVFGNLLPQQLWGPLTFGTASGNIRIHWQFSLTAGDTVSTKGFFQVEQVPEPATIALIGLGLAALVAARKRA
jgi:hypothetical protein